MNVPHQIVIGCGETGGPLADLLERSGKHVLRHDPAKGHDATAVTIQGPAVLHICLPGNHPEFHQWVKEALDAFGPLSLVVIHSTVPVGTTRAIAETHQTAVPIVHSPIRGTHGRMLQDLQRYVKLIGYDHPEDYQAAVSAMDGCFEMKGVPDSRSTELGKLLELARYGMNIAFAREQDELCQQLGLEYGEVVDLFVDTYNRGMESRGTPDLRQQRLTAPRGPIGGHCVLPGMRMVCESYQPSILTKAYVYEAAVAHEASGRGKGETIKLAQTMLGPFPMLPPPTNDQSAHPGVFMHLTAVVSHAAVIGHGTKIWHWSHVRGGATIGRDCVIGQGCYIAEDAVIGDRVHIQNGVSVYNGVRLEDDVFVGPHVVFTNDRYPPSGTITETVVRKGASIGAGAVIICGVTIEEGAKIGAGAVVTKDVPRGYWHVGNPAHELVQESVD